jgi:hypothetical protein
MKALNASGRGKVTKPFIYPVGNLCSNPVPGPWVHVVPRHISDVGFLHLGPSWNHLYILTTYCVSEMAESVERTSPMSEEAQRPANALAPLH